MWYCATRQCFCSEYYVGHSNNTFTRCTYNNIIYNYNLICTYYSLWTYPDGWIINIIIINGIVPVWWLYQIPNVIVFYYNIFVHIVSLQFTKHAQHNFYFNHAYFIKILNFSWLLKVQIVKYCSIGTYLITNKYIPPTRYNILCTYWMPYMYTVYWHNNILLYHASGITY